jgi:hypothetical protein
MVTMYTLDQFSNGDVIYAKGNVDLVRGTMSFAAFPIQWTHDSKKAPAPEMNNPVWGHQSTCYQVSERRLFAFFLAE